MKFKNWEDSPRFERIVKTSKKIGRQDQKRKKVNHRQFINKQS